MSKKTIWDAAREGNLDLLKKHIDNDISPDIQEQDSFGWTPLQYAIRAGRKNAVEYLLKMGASKDGKNKQQQTPLHTAAVYGKVEICQFLLEKGASFNVEDKHGSTPIQKAIDTHHKQVEKCLKEWMAKPEKKPDHLSTAFRAVKVSNPTRPSSSAARPAVTEKTEQRQNKPRLENLTLAGRKIQLESKGSVVKKGPSHSNISTSNNLNEDDLLNLSSEISQLEGDAWKFVLRRLGIFCQVNSLVKNYSNDRERTYQGIMLWQSKCGENATRQAMCNALREEELIKIADKLEKAHD